MCETELQAYQQALASRVATSQLLLAALAAKAAADANYTAALANDGTAAALVVATQAAYDACIAANPGSQKPAPKVPGAPGTLNKRPAHPAA